MPSRKWLCVLFFLSYAAYTLPFRKVIGNDDQRAAINIAIANDHVAQLYNDIVYIQDQNHITSAIEEINKANKRHLVYAISLPIVIFLSIVPWLI